jgi:hypothetical protein
MSTRKRTNRLQYIVCKCEVESTRKWSNIGVLFNQPHFNLVPKVWGLIQEQKIKQKRWNEICKLKGTKAKESTKPNSTTHTLGFHLNTQRTLSFGCRSRFSTKILRTIKWIQLKDKSQRVPIWNQIIQCIHLVNKSQWISSFKSIKQCIHRLKHIKCPTSTTNHIHCKR